MFLLPINIWAVVFSAALCLGVGFVWYSPVLFGKTWMKLRGISPKNMTQLNKHMAVRYTQSFIAALFMMYILSQLESLALTTSAAEGATLGVMVWFGFVAAAMVNTVLFEGKPWTLFFIESGYYLTCLLISGAILAVWI